MASTKQDRRLAEVAAVHWCHERLECVETRRSIRTQWQKVDFFAADVMGKLKDGSMVWVQATAGSDSAVTARRRKLEAIPWADSDFVCVVQLRKMKDPANARRWLYFFRVCEYEQINGKSGPREWTVWDDAEAVPREWLKVSKD